MSAASADNFWLFGYGSLIWKAPPHYDRRVPGFIKGYVRRFWQGLAIFSAEADTSSEDHRGTPAAPGRVVTLIERAFWQSLNDLHFAKDDDHVWGVAYHIIPSKVKEVQEYLDIREINGYSIQYTPFHPADREQSDIDCMVYIGMPDNPQFLGALEPQAVALKINESRGPSGENREYLLNLEEALMKLSPESHDEHISDLARRVRTMSPPDRTELQDISGWPVIHKSTSTQEQEEVEKTV